MIGKTILGYTINEKIGVGGFGTVYRVSKTNASGTYTRALKHITIPNQKQYADVLNSMGGDHAKANDYFASVLNEIVNEIQIISKLSESGTKNIVRYYENDIVETDSPKKYDIYILMECLTPFTDYIYENEFTVRDAVKLGKNVLEALVSCHGQNVIHRDIKDDNIFVSKDGTFKLGDFGVSKILTDRSRAESMKGTPNYIAPEVYLGKEKYDDTVDLYSLGIVLYKLLNKARNPFLPEYPSPYNTDDEYVAFDKRMKGEIPNLPYDAKNQLGEVIVKAISPRSQRYNSAKEFLNDLIAAEATLSEEELNIVVNQAMPKKEKAQHQETEDDMTLKVDPELIINQININNSDDNRGFAQNNNSMNTYEPAKDNNSNKKLIAYALPAVIALIYIIIYFLVLPKLYGRAVGALQWAINNPNELAESLMNEEEVFPSLTTIWFVKLMAYGLWIAFIASLYNLGHYLQNKKPAYNPNAHYIENEAYLKAMELNEAIKASKCRDAEDAKRAVRTVMEKLRNESSFGYGSDSVINCELDIARALQEIEANIHAMYDEKTAKNSGEVIVANCKAIQTKLKTRMEMKKK